MQASKSRSRGSGHVYLAPPSRTVWHLRYRLPDGRESRKRIGPNWTGRGRPPAGCFTEAMARAELAAFLELRAGAGADPRLSAAIDAWLDELAREGRSNGTVGRYRSIAERQVKPALGDRRLSDVTTADVIALREQLAGEGLSASSLNKVRTVLVGAYKRARHAHGYMGPNVGLDFERRSVKPSGVIDVYSPAEVEALARHAASEQDAAIFRVAAYAGLRLSEIRALRWRHVEFAAATIRVRAGYTNSDGEGLPKSRRGRVVPLIDQAAAALNDLSRREHFTGPDDLVFCNELGGVLDNVRLYRRYIAAAEDAGLYRLVKGKRRVLRFHDLRHTFGTIAVQAWPVTDVQGYMGHADISTTMVYVHFKPHTDAARRLTELVSAAVDVDAAWDRSGTVGTDPVPATPAPAAP